MHPPDAHPPIPEEAVLATGHAPLAVRLWGPTEGVPVLALHGWQDNAATFDVLGPLLTECRLAALDLPGHGLSEARPPGVHYHLVDYVGDVLAAADALGWERFSLLGHSMGAAVAVLVAAVVPERIASLALIEGLGPLSGDPVEEPQRLRKALRQMRERASREGRIYANFQAAVNARVKRGPIPARAACALALRGTEPVAGGVRWRNDPRIGFRSPVYLTESQVLAFLTAIEAPTLLVLGEAGMMHAGSFSQRREAVRDLRVEQLPGGHYVHFDSSVSLASLLVAHFR